MLLFLQATSRRPARCRRQGLQHLVERWRLHDASDLEPADKALEQPCQRLHLSDRSRCRHLHQLRAQVPVDTGQRGASSDGEPELHSSAVAGHRAAFKQAGPLEPADHRAQRGSLHVDACGECGSPLGPVGYQCQHSVLGQGQARLRRRLLQDP